MASPYGEDIAVLKDQMKDVKSSLERIEGKLDSSAATYATKAELRSFKWITVPLVIILTAVITSLVGYYFTHNKPAPQTTVTNTNTTSPASGATPASSSTTNTTSNTTNTPSTPSSDSSGGLLNDPLKQVGL